MDDATPQKQGWGLTQEAFDKLLVWFDSDRERAGEKYEMMRLKLLEHFEHWGCVSPEDYTDETFNRVARKIEEGKEIHNPDGYFYRVARMIFREGWRKEKKVQVIREHSQPRPNPNEPDESDKVRCAKQCLQSLPPESRELLEEYYEHYEGEGGRQIEIRQTLARRLRITPNALHIRASRLRKKMEDCILECLKRLAAQ